MAVPSVGGVLVFNSDFPRLSPDKVYISYFSLQLVQFVQKRVIKRLVLVHTDYEALKVERYNEK